MKKWVAISIVVGVVALLTSAAVAQMGWGHGYSTGWGHGPGMMGWGPGAGMGPGQYSACPGAGGPTASPVTEENAKQVAQQYADKYLKGYTIETVLPFTGMGGWTAYSVELKGPKDELRIIHVNPWGGVMPFGGPGRRAG